MMLRRRQPDGLPSGEDSAATRRLLTPFLKPQWPALAGAAAATVVLTCVELAKPWPLALAIDQIVRSRHGAFHLGGGTRGCSLQWSRSWWRSRWPRQ